MKKTYRIIISGLLLFGLNQSLILALAPFPHALKRKAVPCACPPSACMCPPTAGCEHHSHNKRHNRKNGTILSCGNSRPHHLSSLLWDTDIPILTDQLDSRVPLFAASLEKSPNNALSQDFYPSTDKPPQINSV
ncbi:MAG: hypothetical protein ACE5GM_03335 [bacterium]